MFESTFYDAIKIIEEIEAKGHRAYIVGGAVRDFLNDRKIHDVDIASSATPTEIQEIFTKVIPVGIEHGTVIVRYNHQSFEITTFRTETGYTDYRHPDQVEFVRSIYDDLARRDFTINAIAMDKMGKIIDPYSGKLDIDRRIIRAVGNPEDRFTEDPLRMLRALRFVSQLDFEVEPATLKAISKQIHYIKNLAMERISVEFEKMLAGSNFKSALILFKELNAWTYLPVLEFDRSLINCLFDLPVPLLKLYECFAYLKMKDDQVDMKQLTKSFKQSKETFRNAEQLVTSLVEYKVDGLSNWLIYKLPESLYESFFRLVKALFHSSVAGDLKARRKHLAIQSRKELAVSGTDIIIWYPDRAKGQWIQTLLNRIEYAVVENQIDNNIDAIKEWINSCHPPENN